MQADRGGAVCEVGHDDIALFDRDGSGQSARDDHITRAQPDMLRRERPLQPRQRQREDRP